MKRLPFALVLLIVHAAVFAQPKPGPGTRPKSAARMLQVEVFHFGENGARKAEAGLFVTLKQNGASKQTNDLGQCRLELPEGYAAGEMVTLVIDKTDWRIRYPLDGEARIPLDLKKEVVEVELLPIGSKLFWTNDRIEKFVRDLAAKSTQQAPAPNAEEKPDFVRFIKDWAVQYGFSAEQAKAEMDKWIAEIEAKSNDLNRLGLAAFAKKNFAEAAKNFEAAFAQDSTQLAAAKKQKQALEEKEKQLTSQAIENARLAGDSHYNDNRFEKALSAYHSAQQLVDKTKAAQQWANLALKIGNANWELGIRTKGESIQKYLNAAQQAYERAGEVWPREREPEGWAAVQGSLGNLLSQQGTRTGGEEGAKLLAQAVTAYENALQVYTWAQLPQQWATTQNNLGTLYWSLGTRTGGENGAKWLAQAVTAYEKALEVRTRAQLPQDWAMTQDNLGIVLRDLGTRTGGEEGAKLLGQAVTAYENALEVRTRAQLPQDWARTQNNLGVVLHDLGMRTGGEEGAKLLKAAVTAYENALVVRTREQLPQQWATTQNNLGLVNNGLGTRTGGEEGAKWLGHAVTAYESALVVFTRAQLPQQWATTQNNLGNVYWSLGTRTGGEEGAKLLAQAVTAYENALEVRTRAQLPQDWAMTQNNLGTVLRELGTRTGGEEGAKLLAQAVTAFENALEVYTREQLPQGWAGTQNNLGSVLSDLGTRVGGEEGAKLLAQAVTAYENALVVYTYEHIPTYWAMAQNNLAETYTHLEDWPNVAACYANVLKVYPRYAQAFQTASYLYHEALFNFPAAFALDQNWLAQFPDDPSAQCYFAENHFTTSRFAECEQRLAALLANAEVEPRVKIALRAIGIANALAQNQTQPVPAALETLQAALAAQPDTFKVNWSFAGTKHFIGTNETLAPHRAWLLQFFEAVERKAGRVANLAGLKEVKASFMAATKK